MTTQLITALLIPVAVLLLGIAPFVRNGRIPAAIAAGIALVAIILVLAVAI